VCISAGASPIPTFTWFSSVLPHECQVNEFKWSTIAASTVSVGWKFKCRIHVQKVIFSSSASVLTSEGGSGRRQVKTA
jgi:hypothetical protein